MVDNCKVAAVDSILAVGLAHHKAGPGNQVELMGYKADWEMVVQEAAHHTEVGTVAHIAEELVVCTAAHMGFEGHCMGTILEHQLVDQASLVAGMDLSQLEVDLHSLKQEFVAQLGCHLEVGYGDHHWLAGSDW